MRLSDINISTKLTLIAVASSAAAILCVVIAFVVQDLRLVNQIKDEQIRTHNAFISTSLSIAIDEHRKTMVYDLLLSTLSDYGIVAAAVISPDSTLYASINFPELEENKPVSLLDFFRYAKSPAFSSAVGVYQHDIPVANSAPAILVTLVSLEDVQQRIWFMAGYSVMAFILAMFISLCVSWLVQRMVSNPIQQLSGLIRRIKLTGDYSLRSEGEGSDELGELSEGFNAMLEQIRLKDKNLEKQVLRRTQELEELAEAFRYRAFHDPLTDLPNRALLQEEFYRAVAHANRSGKYFALMLMDVDDFKQVNDTYGHEFGDELLKEVARHIRCVVRAEDRVCRMGGDEFIVLMENISSETTVRTIGENLLKDLNNELNILNVSLKISVSIGASIYPRHGGQLGDLKRKADVAMYHSKEEGKNRLTVFQGFMERKASHRQLVKNDLDGALKNNELEINYQPQVDIEAGKLVAVEALVRWRNPEYGMLKPGEFIGLAEGSDLIRNIDYHVIKYACSQSADWLATLGRCIPISVNVSGVHFRDMDIVNFIDQTLHEYGIGGKHLIVELTQAVLGEDETCVRRVVDALRELCVRSALDNFGTPASSLHYLRCFRVDILKLDKSFSRFVHSSEREKRLAKGIISLAKDYGVTLVAEGVETESQAASLTSLGCSITQGYWHAKPCNRQMFEQWLEAFEHKHVA
ncbi:putative bifunctional diguanylate cyclase/phosphodiesterase [Teredinibacter haidensis]|uniref:putative bifunctional diguanylate cyclase/phosphodiesterase n=1 Tax=Teredinibacter haidensis TaxID=2731755 RepID=UPI000B31F456|nr:EAL domain-containing protein [Teredinibacter haidensis]